MPVSAAIIEREPLVLSPSETGPFLSVSERSPSRLISEGKIEARKHGPRTRVDVALLKAPYAGLPKKTDHAPIVCSTAALTPCRVRLRDRGTDAPIGRIRT